MAAAAHRLPAPEAALSFQWPEALAALAVVPLLAGLYVASERRRARAGARFGNPALLRGRDYVTAEDVHALTKDALRHRLVLSYQALAEGITPDTILDKVLAAVPVPEVTLARPSIW